MWWKRLPTLGKKLSCNGNSTILLFSVNNTMIHEKIIPRVIVLLTVIAKIDIPFA